mgnify:CR=1 FL=1
MKIHYQVEGPIGIFTLDNGKVNAITPQMHKELHDHMKSFLSDNSVRCGVMTGAGQQAFSGGDDIKTDWGYPDLHDTLMAHFSPSSEDRTTIRPGWERELRAIDRYKPIVGALNGPALGMGFFYVMTFMDIRVATPNAFLSLPEIAYGMGGIGGSTQLWRHLPPSVAMDMVLLGEKLTAEQAQTYGLYKKIVDHPDLMETALGYARKIASFPELGVRVEMEGFYRSMDMSRRDNSAFMEHLYRLQRAAYLTGENASAHPLDPTSPEQQKIKDPRIK